MDYRAAHMRISEALGNGQSVFFMLWHGHCEIVIGVNDYSERHHLFTLITCGNSKTTLDIRNFSIQECEGRLYICPAGMIVCGKECAGNYRGMCIFDKCEGFVEAPLPPSRSVEEAKEDYRYLKWLTIA